MINDCQWDCGCWDCRTDRRNSIRFTLGLVALIALLGGAFVAFELQGSLEPEQEPGAAMAGPWAAPEERLATLDLPPRPGSTAQGLAMAGLPLPVAR